MKRHGPLSLKPFLTSLLHEAYDDKQANLQMADLRALAAEYSMRLDDVVSTLIDLVNEGGWHYHHENGEPTPLSQELSEGEARLSASELNKMTGSWSPVITDEG
ncbi:MAG: hypothetical protein COB33_005970 [Thiotrichaceae bacterium]|nr:hypothetical protein [Thiotrichaceae bacterium]PCI13481.1 MAG: hypothetical protein COB71_05845 [Thiotrichales bacterium]